jgi:hypothetical protein
MAGNKDFSATLYKNKPAEKTVGFFDNTLKIHVGNQNIKAKKNI